MSEFNVRSDGVDVEQIMQQIRSRIRDKRGVDYTEDQIQELARVKLEKFLDPKGVRSDLLEQFRRTPVPQSPEIYAFDDKTLYESDKAIVRFLRKLFRPLLKLLFNPNTLNHVLHTQTGINRYMVEFTEHRASRDMLYYEIIHNLVVEVTRATIEVKNMKMRVESIASRLEFNERRARALEAVVQYKPGSDIGPRGADAGRQERDRDRGERGRDREGHRDRDGSRDRERRVVQARHQAPAPNGGDAVPNPPDPITGGDSLRSRRKRRRRGRRSGPGFGEGGATPGESLGEGAAVNLGEGTTDASPHEGAPVNPGEGTAEANLRERTPVNLGEGTPEANPRERTPVNLGEGTPEANPRERTPVNPGEGTPEANPRERTP
ncbi:MAG TPA: hypothetical protein VFV33_25415, partial [Gemmatimonadaceae bacterium]|nr:hypothetical protein [Gemmatimonadaceae bacterium]